MKYCYLLKTFFLLLCVSLLYKASIAQSYHNEWIDYSKTYYKFKVAPFGFDIVGAPIKNGVVRITQPSLVSAGLGAVPAEQFQLWNNGAEVSIYTSKSAGIFSANDYIEFWGEIAGGKLDKDLYKDSSLQVSDHWSLETDSASYFLTVNATGSNLRLVNTANNVLGTSLIPEKNFMYTTGRYYRSYMNSGYYITVDQTPLYLSSLDVGEGWSSRPVHPNNCGCSQTQLPQNFTNLFADPSGPNMTLKVNMAGNALNDRSVKILLNNDSISQVSMGYFLSSKTFVQGIDANKIVNDSATIIIQDISNVPDDEMRVGQTELTYPRKFNFGGDSSFEFYIAASATGRYLKIANFSANNSTPVLYDVTNNTRYAANNSVTDTFRFVLQPSASAYHLILVRGDGSSAKFITAFEQRNFINYSQTPNQGNYLIISNPLIYGSGNSNYVDQYKSYRRSAAGGNYNAKLVNIHELEDQFAWGIKMHPLAIKNFLKYGRNIFQTKPEYVFLIGKGVSYPDYRLAGNSPLVDHLNLVPTYGSPGSDNLLSALDFNDLPVTPIGRLSAVSAQEVGDYLQKVKQYEAAQNNINDSIENKGWMKNVLHLTGANDAVLGVILDSDMQKYSNIISDTFYGGNVTTFSKSADPAGYGKAVVDFTNIYNQGSGIVQYFGHSSSSNIDFSLDDPNNYQNYGKYPFFIVNGCLAGNIFDYEITRQTHISTLSEKFVLAPQKGSIAYLSTSSFGIVNYLDIFTNEVYKSISLTAYNRALGNVIKQALTNGLNLTGATDFYGKMHAQQYTLHGDPALHTNSFSLPDYAVQTNYITVKPDFISAADDSFTIKVHIYNLGKAVSDSVHFVLLREGEVVFKKELPYITALDSVEIKLPLIPNRDTGTITYRAHIDNNNKIAELDENNNDASVKVVISSKDIQPIYPYNYSIVTDNKINFVASTAYPLAEKQKYIFETDTTALFNSPLKKRLHRTSVGGLIESPQFPVPPPERVYYWRIAASEVNPHWNVFSFIHKKGGNSGFEQQHFYQHTESDLKQINLDSGTRQYEFSDKLTNLFVQQSIYPTSGVEDAQFSVAVNGTYVGESACVGSSIVFNVFDSITFKALTNTTNPFGAASPCKPLTENNFEYSTQTAASRKNAMDFLDNYVPNGYYLVVRKIYDLGNTDWAPTVWAADTALYGHNNSLYHRFKDQGLLIDSFTYPRTFVFVYRKNDSANFSPVSKLSEGLYDRITLSQNITTKDTVAYVTSPKFGPGKNWNNVQWKGYDINNNNTAGLDVIAIDKNGADSIFYHLDKLDSIQNISAINASLYPYIQLKMKTSDTSTAIPYQLKDWLVECTQAPEGAIAPNLGINIPDTISFNHAENIMFDTLQGYVVFKNISTSNFKKLKLKFILYDSNGIAHNYYLPRTRALPAGDTVHVSFLVNVKALPEGLYNLFIEVNPNNDQPEQYNFNNRLYKDLYIDRSGLAPEIAAKTLPAKMQAHTTSVYPNPFTRELHINANSRTLKSTVRLFSAEGKMLLQKDFLNTTTLLLHNLMQGIYLIEISNANGKEIFKVEKESNQ